MKEIKLSNDWKVRVQAVPPYLMTPVYEQYPEPDFPIIREKSVSGGTEEAPAQEGSEEWNRWMKEHREWRLAINAEAHLFRLSYGVMSWKPPDSDEFTDTVPEWYDVPQILQDRYGVVLSDDKWERKAQFVRFFLLGNYEDADKVESVVGIREATVSSKEVDAQMVPFESQTNGEDH